MILEIVFAAGCFWGVEKHYENIPGVVSVESGYTGGNYDNPTYQSVLANKAPSKTISWFDDESQKPTTQTTNHTEAVRVLYDDKIVSTEYLIKDFWELHDPTQKDGQGNDIGNNYRSALYWSNPIQQKIAEKTREEFQQLLSKKGFGKIVTELQPLKKFWKAEEYHQDYLAKNPNGYCPNHQTGVVFTDKKTPKNVQVSDYNAHLKNLILKPLGGKEIIVIESDSYCPYCEVFRENVLNNYKGDLPIRSILARHLTHFEITTPTFATPTILFIDNGKEVAGFQGYLSPEKFYRALGKFMLNKAAFEVAFNEGTDARYCQQYDIFKNTPDGIFVDKLSGVALFDTNDRFNSKSGWLSFYKAVDGATLEKIDERFGMKRLEVIAKHSGVHLGHVFEDAPNGKRRFCINATVLDFKPR
jgi:peptide methionine sulfoxide reductase msrA/msrB